MRADPKEIENFAKDADKWWDINGPFKPLHKLNPARLGYIKQQICGHFKRDMDAFDSYSGLLVLDVGCGGGLVCEPITRLGAEVTGIDADAQGIAVAKEHAKQSELTINYQAMTSNELEEQGEKYDVVLALEIIEHVSSKEEFVQSIMNLVKPDGLVIFSTLNRNPKSFALGIIAAEYILRWVPHGTHNWKKFVKPSELTNLIRQNDGDPYDICGLAYNPINDDFFMTKKDLDVNYFISAIYSGR